ncbi:transmembrane proteins 14C-domain-containing protein [Entophlyctis helioformis]|nr:transmembrane proteins 14C-domain-containing protein [Entophlyctis helioformis]KAI8924838.1 transmembrane proteins 14C-domain-containing protein [Entophlyctis helioformis]
MSFHVSATIGAICAAGGAIGYVKGKSVPSLVAGLTFGALFATASFLIRENRDYGVELAAVSSVLLAGAMLPKAIRARKPVPITLSVLGTLGSAYYAKKWLDQSRGV